ncbi:MAG: hypothetical protein KA007_00910 [Candidatus Pacebacteria bacterium]|jgi:hypothetical protein|nr:hypothetical protein [Candidatus Paceibacterota bacterium]
MADKPKAPDAMKDLKNLLLILIGIFFLWYLTGGYERAQNLESPYLNLNTSSIS